MIYEYDPRMKPDAEFEPGVLEHIAVGNRGRLLDPRRTPVSIAAVDLDTGQFHVRIEHFEDRGALWEIPLESVKRFQFERAARRIGAADVAAFRAIIERFDRPLRVPCDAAARDRTLARIAARRTEAGAWLERHSGFLGAGGCLDFSARTGPPALADDFAAFLRERELSGMEDAFATRYVSNPRSGELVKGHRVVCAELGLVPFDGTVVRDRRLFDAPWTRARRAEHIEHRAAFVQALFAACGHEYVTLHRGLASEGPPTPPLNHTFVSATFNVEVARGLMGARDTTRTGVLLSQPVPIGRVFMTYFETAAMNRKFHEAEAVLFWEGGNTVF